MIPAVSAHYRGIGDSFLSPISFLCTLDIENAKKTLLQDRGNLHEFQVGDLQCVRLAAAGDMFPGAFMLRVIDLPVRQFCILKRA